LFQLPPPPGYAPACAKYAKLTMVAAAKTFAISNQIFS